MIVLILEGLMYSVGRSARRLTDHQAPHLLANEHIGSAIAKAVGIPVVASKSLFFSESFIDKHPTMWFDLSSGLVS